MSKESLLDSWKSEKFRKSVVDKINEELKGNKLSQINGAEAIEKAIYEKAQTKQQYLGYAAKIILAFRRMVCIGDQWLENKVKEILNKPPPRLRQVLPPEKLAEFNVEMMKLKRKIKEMEENRGK